MSPMILQETDKVHQLFKAFHSHGLPKKVELCENLKQLIDDGVIRGSAQIGDLLYKLISEEIDDEKLEEAVCKVLDMKEENLDNFRKDPDYEPNSSDDDSDTDDDDLDNDMGDNIQLAQRVPEMNDNDPAYPPAPPHLNPPLFNFMDPINKNNLSENEKKEISHLCKMMVNQIKKLEQVCLNESCLRALHEVKKTQAYSANLEVIKYIVD